MRPMASTSGTRTCPLNECSYWQAEKQLLPRHMRGSDNTQRVSHYKAALRDAIKTKLSDKERDHLRLFYEKRMTKTQIGELYGVGSSTVCKTLKSAEAKVREYVELYMQIYSKLEKEKFDEDDGIEEICGGQISYARHKVNN